MDLRFLKFLAVGLTTMLVQFSSFALMWDIFHLPQRLSVSISYVSAVTFHFFSNRVFTFQAGNASVYRQLFKYIIVTCLNYVITIVVVDVCVKDAFLVSLHRLDGCNRHNSNDRVLVFEVLGI